MRRIATSTTFTSDGPLSSTGRKSSALSAWTNAIGIWPEALRKNSAADRLVPHRAGVLADAVPARALLGRRAAAEEAAAQRRVDVLAVDEEDRLALRRSRHGPSVGGLRRAPVGAVLTEKTAPAGSAMTASREIAVSNGPATTRAAEVRRPGGGGVGVVDPEVDDPCRGPPERGRHDRDDVARHGLRRLAADVAGEAPQRALRSPSGNGSPVQPKTSRRRTASRGSGSSQRRTLIVQAPGSLTTLRAARARPAAQTPKRRAGRVGDDRDPPAVEAVERRGDERAARLERLRDGVVDGGDLDVGGPRGRRGAAPRPAPAGRPTRSPRRRARAAGTSRTALLRRRAW